MTLQKSRTKRGGAWIAAVIGLLAPAAMMKADSIPYANIGTIAPTHTFTATSNGDIVAYFYASSAAYSSTIGLLVNGVSTGIFGLPNHSSAYGQSLDLGSVHAGDTLVFQLAVADLGHSWYSDPTLNVDGVNHAYSTAFGGDTYIPAGTYVGFEDLPNGSADFDYNDHQFVFTNVSARGVPEPGSLLLLSLALGGLALASRLHIIRTSA